MAIIYLLTNKENGRQYVGKTVQPFDIRWGGHVGSARRGDNGMLVCRAIKKHSPEAFERKVLEECDESVLGEREVHWIAELKTHVSQGGYNLTYGGDSGLSGYVFSEESKEKMRQKALGRKLSPEARAKISAANKGRKHSTEAIAKRVAANTGRKRTEEQRARISESLKGRTLSDETRKKIGAASQGRVTSETTKQKFYKVVAQLSLDGNLIAVHKSLTDAAKAAGLSKGAMSGVVRSDRLVAGSYWRYQIQE